MGFGKKNVKCAMCGSTGAPETMHKQGPLYYCRICWRDLNR